MELAKSEQYKEARQIFEDLAAKQPKNPDVINMLAYTQRKTGDLDQALDNYHAALKLKPKFPQAREYLGEAYLQAAMREAETLKGYGSTDELHKLAAAFQEAASKLEANAKGDAKSGW
jgi:Flp pilus assembly protein TadD